MDLTVIDPWWRFGAALLLGALIGLEREFIQQKKDVPDFAGIRTFSLIALSGAVVGFLTEDFGLAPAIAVLSGVMLLIIASHIMSVHYSITKGGGITSEVAAILTFLFGMMAAIGFAEIAIALAVVTTLLLSLKGSLHEAIRQMSAEDLRITLEFGIVALVILPILPNRPIDPLGVLNLFNIWLLVVLVSGVGFAGYLLIKILGENRGVWITGLLGGVVSSTATTISFSTRSRNAPATSLHAAQAILLASTVMLARVLVIIAIISTQLLSIVAIPLLVMFFTGMVLVYILSRQDQVIHPSDNHEVGLNNPLKLRTAIVFGMIFAVVLVIVQVAQMTFGDSGVYVTSFIAGLADVDTIVLSMTTLLNGGQIQFQVAGTAILIAALMNTFAKGFIAFTAGANELRRYIALNFAILLFSGIISTLVLLNFPL